MGKNLPVVLMCRCDAQPLGEHLLKVPLGVPCFLGTGAWYMVEAGGQHYSKWRK